MAPQKMKGVVKGKSKGLTRAQPRKRQGLVSKNLGVQTVRKSSHSYLAQPPRDPQSLAYLNALIAPFEAEAVGARVPEPYEVLTRTTKNISLYTIRPSNASFTVGTTVVGAGFASGVIMPHANYTVATCSQASAGANCSITGGQAQSIFGVGSSDWKVSGNVGQSVLRDNYETYRLVAMGVKFRSNMSFTDAAGRMVVAIVPSMNTFPGTTTALGSTNGGYADALNTPFDTGSMQVSTDILSLPTSKEYSITDLLSGSGVEVRVPLTSPLCKQFLVTDTNLGPGIVSIASTNLINGFSQQDAYSMGGFSNIMFAIEGMKEGTTITLEIVQHFEGIPRLANQSGTSGILVDQSMQSHTSTPMMAEVCAQAANRRPVQDLASRVLGPIRAFSDRKGGLTKTAINAGGEAAKAGAGKLALSLMGLAM